MQMCSQQQVRAEDSLVRGSGMRVGETWLCKMEQGQKFVQVRA